jgi:hypothetical protein
MTAPHAYAVYVHPSDYQRLLPHRAYLEEEWATLLQEVAQRVGISLVAPPRVELREDDLAVLGAIEIDVLDSLSSPQTPRSQVLALRVIKGMPAGERYAISQPMRVGRSRESDIFLVDPSVSRAHATLEPQGDHLIVRDSGSTNGTFVNGERIQLRVLRAGDLVAFGKTEMAVEAEPQA